METSTAPLCRRTKWQNCKTMLTTSHLGLAYKKHNADSKTDEQHGIRLKIEVEEKEL